jgi:gliding motility-associated-like protein
MIEYPLENKSQIVCARPDDDRLPCPPTLTFEGPDCTEFLSDKICGFNDFEHDLSWEPDFSGVCDDELNEFRLYFNQNGEDGQFTLVGTYSPFEFAATITNLTNYRGCYYITAVDRSGNESEPSNIVCVDNCPSFDLPNAFTPNGDGINDTFMAFDNPFNKCPRFVVGVEIFIVNRWGVEVFSYNSLSSNENDIFIRWNGRDKNGNELPAGTYFYSAMVRFDALDPSLQEKKLKGTVQIIR